MKISNGLKRYCLNVCFLLVIFLVGCGYTPVPQVLPEYIKKISVQEFFDQTGHLIVTRKLTKEIIREFLQDRRLEVVNREFADGLLIGEITRYILEPLSFDENYVPQEYKLWIWVDVGLKDMATDKMLWVEKRMVAEVRYFVTPKKGDEFLTEEEAQDIAVKSLAKDIVKRTIDRWFAASGISEKK